MNAGEEFARKYVSREANRIHQPNAVRTLEQLLAELDRLRAQIKVQRAEENEEIPEEDPSWILT